MDQHGHQAEAAYGSLELEPEVSPAADGDAERRGALERLGSEPLEGRPGIGPGGPRLRVRRTQHGHKAEAAQGSLELEPELSPAADGVEEFREGLASTALECRERGLTLPSDRGGRPTRISLEYPKRICDGGRVAEP